MDTEPRIQPIQSLSQNGLKVDMLRLDELHGAASGNKWYKLHYHYLDALLSKAEAMLSFGGAYSNHLAALAAYCHEKGMPSIGIIRGEELHSSSNATLRHCCTHDMQLHFAARSQYQLKEKAPIIKDICQGKKIYIVPEGGYGALGIKGAAIIADYIPTEYTHILLSVGTGTTLQGIESRIKNQKIMAFAPFKKMAQISADFRPAKNTQLILAPQFGGFGRVNPYLIAFANAFYRNNGIPLDLVYTAKMMAALEYELAANPMPKGTRILAIHTGGLQGNAAYKEQLIF